MKLSAPFHDTTFNIRIKSFLFVIYYVPQALDFFQICRFRETHAQFKSFNNNESHRLLVFDKALVIYNKYLFGFIGYSDLLFI